MTGILSSVPGGATFNNGAAQIVGASMRTGVGGTASRAGGCIKSIPRTRFFKASVAAFGDESWARSGEHASNGTQSKHFMP